MRIPFVKREYRIHAARLFILFFCIFFTICHIKWMCAVLHSFSRSWIPLLSFVDFNVLTFALSLSAVSLSSVQHSHSNQIKREYANNRYDNFFSSYLSSTFVNICCLLSISPWTWTWLYNPTLPLLFFFFAFLCSFTFWFPLLGW